MAIHSVLFVLLSLGAYLLIAYFAQLTGGTHPSLLKAIAAMFKPLPLAVLLVGNAAFVSAIFFGLKVSNFAIPAAIALGVVASFIYSALFLGGAVTLLKILGIALILLGIALIR